MHDKHLETFLAVAEAGSFTSAAEKLYLSHTALIQQINLLEERTGVRLFTRHSKGVTLTAAGEYFSAEARKLIRASRLTLQRCRAMQEATMVRIGILPNFRPVLLPELCRRFGEEHPEYAVQFVEYPLDEYFRRFAEHRFDITAEYLAGYIYDAPDYRRLNLLTDRHCCGVPKSHPLASKATLTIDDLHGQSLVMYRRGITRADDCLRDYLSTQAADIDLIDVSAYNRALALKCELSNQLLVYYSRYTADLDPLQARPLALGVEIPIELGLGWREGCSAAVSAFIATAKRVQVNALS